ncbi:MAG: 3-deoxy-D-manno-octulosonic acid transferase, partial [Geobacter sp.]|nr:3-deoxy-D-manno-octulosonic acid transferase [Geobacter sp.]
MFYLLYNFISVFLLVPVCLFTVYRSFRLNWPMALAPRFGLIPAAELAKIRGRRVILLHAVSVGEVFAARVLIKALRTSYPEHALVVSTGTETGRQTALALPEVDLCVYFPFDFLPSVRRMLTLLQPDIVIVMETEIWPNFTREIARRKIPLVMANGRISDRSYGRYLKLSWFFRHALQNFTLLCMQSETTRERIINIGAPADRVVVSGNLKFDLPLQQITADDRAELRQRYRIPGECLVIIAGSTHDGEEALLLDVYRELQAAFDNLFLVLAPR